MVQHSAFVFVDLVDLSDPHVKTEVIATNRPHDLDSADASEVSL